MQHTLIPSTEAPSVLPKTSGAAAGLLKNSVFQPNPEAKAIPFVPLDQLIFEDSKNNRWKAGDLATFIYGSDQSYRDFLRDEITIRTHAAATTAVIEKRKIDDVTFQRLVVLAGAIVVPVSLDVEWSNKQASYNMKR